MIIGWILYCIGLVVFLWVTFWQQKSMSERPQIVYGITKSFLILIIQWGLIISGIVFLFFSWSPYGVFAIVAIIFLLIFSLVVKKEDKNQKHHHMSEILLKTNKIKFSQAFPILSKSSQGNASNHYRSNGS